MPVSASYGRVPFRQQILFMAAKLALNTTGWTDVYAQEHDWAFMVAGANRDDVLLRFQEAIQRAIEEGRTLEQFREDFDQIVADTGWDYNGGRNWRSRVIYETNMRQSYNAGRYEQQMKLAKAMPYIRYKHSDAVQHPRPIHASWNNKIWRATDPIWNVLFPANGWGCQCYTESLSERDMKRLGKDGPDPTPELKYHTVTIGKNSPNGPRTVSVPEGIDPGFEYAPGRARLNSAMPPQRPVPPISGSAGGRGLPNLRPADLLPAPRRLPADALLPKGLSEIDYASAFLHEFGATMDKPVVFTDVIGESMVIGESLFRDSRGRLKANKRDRGPWMRVLAAALRTPDEIWVRLEWLEAARRLVVRRRYVTRILVDGETTPTLAVFERDKDGWWGITTFQGEEQQANDWRIGVRLFRRDP